MMGRGVETGRRGGKPGKMANSRRQCSEQGIRNNTSVINELVLIELNVKYGD